MLVDLATLEKGTHEYSGEAGLEIMYQTRALIAIAERLDRLCDLVERAQRPDGTLKREKPL